MAKNNLKKEENLGLAVLVVIILTLIVLNFGNITGKATAEKKSVIKVNVESSYGSGINVVNPGDYIYVTIDPGKSRYYYQPKILDEFEDNIIGQISITNCGVDCNSKLPEVDRGKEAKYRLPATLPAGMYKVKVYDRTAEEHVTASFIVRSTPY